MEDERASVEAEPGGRLPSGCGLLHSALIQVAFLCKPGLPVFRPTRFGVQAMCHGQCRACQGMRIKSRQLGSACVLTYPFPMSATNGAIAIPSIKLPDVPYAFGCHMHGNSTHGPASPHKPHTAVSALSRK